MSLRLISAKILSKVTKDGQSLTEALDQGLQAVDEIKDKAFVQALCYGVIRQYHRLDFVLSQLLSKPLRNKDNDIKMLLLIGLYQINSMRVKSHAAVSETVTAAKKKSWAKSLINGVLRQYIRDQTVLEQRADENKTVASSHPPWLFNKFKTDWPEHVEKILYENNQQAPMVLRVNQIQNNVDEYLRLLTEQAILAKKSEICSTAIVLEKPVTVDLLPGFDQGKISVQDTAAQLAAELLEVEKNQVILDLCAAPGGKTAAILERVENQAKVVAVDINAVRLDKVQQNLERLNLQAKTVVGDATETEKWADDQLFDRILVDAPCSALGVIRRHPDIKLLRRETDIDALQEIQQKILQAAWRLLVPGGILLYATCSVLKQENEQQIEAFISKFDDAVHIPIQAEWGLQQKFGRQILTGDYGMDGFYYAKLKKQ